MKTFLMISQRIGDKDVNTYYLDKMKDDSVLVMKGEGGNEIVKPYKDTAEAINFVLHECFGTIDKKNIFFQTVGSL